MFNIAQVKFKGAESSSIIFSIKFISKLVFIPI